VLVQHVEHAPETDAVAVIHSRIPDRAPR
jgi:hypothetical protein